MDLEKRRQAAVNAELSTAGKLQGEITDASRGAMAEGKLPTAGALNRGKAEGAGVLSPGATVTGPSAAELASRAAAAKLMGLRGDIKSKKDPILQAYAALFGDLEELVKTRAGEVEAAAGKNIGKLTEGYTGALPGIDSSYASLGAYDSTDRSRARDAAKKGYETSVEEVGTNKQADLAKVGQYKTETEAGWGADKESILRLIGRVDETENESELYDARNEVEGKLGTLGATRATLNTDAGARGKLSELTGDAGRFDAVKSSLDNVINSSMSGGVKSAAVQAVVNSAGLTDEDKAKVKAMYGDVYSGA